jgi:hypothetical protein
MFNTIFREIFFKNGFFSKKLMFACGQSEEN